MVITKNITRVILVSLSSLMLALGGCGDKDDGGGDDCGDGGCGGGYHPDDGYGGGYGPGGGSLIFISSTYFRIKPMFFNLPPYVLPYLEAAGIFGFAVYVINYALLSFGVLHSECVRFFLLNLCAASLVLVGLTASFNLPSALIQLFWIAISMFAICRRLADRTV